MASPTSSKRFSIKGKRMSSSPVTDVLGVDPSTNMTTKKMSGAYKPSREASLQSLTLEDILAMSHSHESLERSSLLADLATEEIEYDYLLKDKVIMTPHKSPAESHISRVSHGSSRRGGPIQTLITNKRTLAITLPMLTVAKTTLDPRELIAPCTPQQVSKMGGRRVPMHDASSMFATPNTVDKILQRLNPQVKCGRYEAWLRQKEARQRAAFKVVTLDDMIRIHRTCQPGQAAVAMQFDALGRQALQAGKPYSWRRKFLPS